MRSFVGRFLSFLVIIAIAAGAMTLFSRWLDSQVAHLYEEKQDAVSCINDEPAKFKGSAWIHAAADHAPLIFLGTSELNTPVEGGFKTYFPNRQFPEPVSAIGRPHVQNLLHAMDIGANPEAFQGKRLVIFESLQWFFGTDIPTDGFMANFSELQFYEFLRDPKISAGNKAYLCRRFLQLEAKRTDEQTRETVQKDFPAGMNGTVLRSMLRSDYEYPQTHLLATLYLSDSLCARLMRTVLHPYFRLRYAISSIKDKYDTYLFLRTLPVPEKKAVHLRDLSLPFFREDFDARCTPNAIMSSDNDFFKKAIQPVWERDACEDARATVLESREWDDYRFLLSLCRELGVTPFIVNLPTNGRYYDHAGIPSALRQKYFTKNAEVNAQYGVAYFDELKNKEYEPFLFHDEVHLSSKGWRYVSEALVNHWK